MDKSRNLPVVFNEEKKWGLKTSSTYQYELDGKLSSQQKDELLKYAQKQSTFYLSHSQIDHLYELKGAGYILVIDSSGPHDRVHFRSAAGRKSLQITFFGGLVMALAPMLFAFLATERRTTALLIGVLSFITSIMFGFFGPTSPQKIVTLQEEQIVKIIHKIDALLISEKETVNDVTNS